MQCEHIQVLVSGYLDHELTQQEQQQVDVHLHDCADCRHVMQEMRELKKQMGTLSWPKSDLQVLSELEHDAFARTSAGIGWFIYIVGALVIAGMAITEFITSDEATLGEKLVTGLVILGPVLLLASVIRQRVMTYKNDKYNKVKL